MEFNGKFNINNKLLIYPNLTTDEFRKSSLYEGQNLSMFQWIRKESIINNHRFYIGFLFKNEHIHQIQLYCVDKNITSEEKRKEFNAEFIKNIASRAEYSWGDIKSIFNKRENISLIVVNYNR